jgi:hypothetical protein
MKLLKNFILYGSLIISLFFLWKVVLQTPCGRVIEYDIGIFDESFRITQDEFITQIELAEIPWENIADKQLFRYVPGSDFKINLIFSEEQALVYKGDDLENNLDTKQESIDSVQSRYQSAVSRYERAKRDYEKKISKYEQEVIRWNNLGGAPKTEYENLQKEATSLDSKADEISRLLALVNTLTDENNKKVNEYNYNVDQYNTLFTRGHEFDAGNTDGTEINIYSYNSIDELQTLLVHEFGHVLGIEHVEDESSVMYYLLNDKNKKGILSEFDIESLSLSCRL